MEAPAKTTKKIMSNDPLVNVWEKVGEPGTDTNKENVKDLLVKVWETVVEPGKTTKNKIFRNF